MFQLRMDFLAFFFLVQVKSHVETEKVSFSILNRRSTTSETFFLLHELSLTQQNHLKAALIETTSIIILYTFSLSTP